MSWGSKLRHISNFRGILNLWDLLRLEGYCYNPIVSEDRTRHRRHRSSLSVHKWCRKWAVRFPRTSRKDYWPSPMQGDELWSLQQQQPVCGIRVQCSMLWKYSILSPTSVFRLGCGMTTGWPEHGLEMRIIICYVLVIFQPNTNLILMLLKMLHFPLKKYFKQD